MHTRTTQWFTTITAAAMLLAAITTNATANSFSASEQSVRATFSSLEFVGLVSIRCRVTLEASFHSRTFAKVANSLVGAVTSAIVAHPCTNGEGWADNGIESEPLGTAPNRLPFHIQYESFTGNLPAIEAVNIAISRASFVTQATALARTCRGRYGNGTDSIRTVAAREVGTGEITSLTPNGTVSLVEQLGPNAICPATGRFLGRGTAADLSTGARITITLI